MNDEVPAGSGATTTFRRGHLDGATSTRLPRGHGPGPGVGGREPARIAVPVGPGLSAALLAVADRCAVPLPAVLLAAHVAVVSAYGGHEDTLTHAAVGPAGVVPLRVRMHGGTWRELFDRCREPAERDHGTDDEPLTETLTETLFVVTDHGADHGADAVHDRAHDDLAAFPFRVTVRPDRAARTLDMGIAYDAGTFPAELIDRVRHSYLRAFEAITTGPADRFDACDLLARSERERVTGFAHGPRLDDAGTGSVPWLVTRIAARHPDAIAVQHGPEAVSYRALVRRARALAGELRAVGAGPERIVGVLAERSVDQVVALLGVLFSGAAYTPLDAGLPPGRIAAVVRSAGAVAIVHRAHLAGVLPAGVPAVPAGSTPGRAAPEPVPVNPGHAAYVLFTSGSTGEPKGVVVEHRHLSASLAARDVHYRGDPERFLLLSSFAFDSSVAGLFWTLTRGGTLVLPEEGAQTDPAALVDTIAAQRPTHTLGIPSLLAPVLELAGPGEIDSLHTVVAAGEACPAELLRVTTDALPGATLHNEYGPTEATVWSTVWSGDAHDGPQLPIGRPIAGTTVTPRDHLGRLVPLGVTGELMVGGAGVSRGYLGRPAETAAAFRPDPLASRPGGRLYATGDLGRWRGDGQLDYLGRRDHQVKISGFRVELGEVEAVLAGHPAVGRAVVIATGDGGARTLVAYVRPAAAPGGARAVVDTAGLRAHVRDRLPRYMVPSAVVLLDEVPLTPAGKVDRRALPEPAPGDGADDHLAPRTDTERTLAAIWSRVLGRDRIGTGQSFFDLGGESLGAIRAVTAANRVYGLRMPVRTLFEAPTVAGFARAVDAASTRALPGAGHGATDPIRPVPGGPHPLAPGQRSLWVLEQAGASHAAYAEPLLFDVAGPLDAGALRRAALTLLERHESLRTAITVADGVPAQQAVPAELDWSHEVLAGPAAVQQRLAAFVAADFDLAAGRLFRALLIERTPDDHVLALVMHHIATDGWSSRILVDELVTAYDAHRRGAAPALAPLPFQFADVAVRQMRRTATGTADRDHWRTHLAGAQPLDLPADRPRPATRSYRGATIRRTVHPDVLAPMRTLCRDERTTLHAGLITVLRVLLHRYTGSRDIVLGTSALGRDTPELDGQVGYYINSVALRGTVAPGAGFRSLLRDSRTTLLDAIQHSGHPFDEVVADLGLAGTTGRNPLFDVMVMADPGWADPRVDAGGLRLTRRHPPNAHSKMDLTLFTAETGAGLELTAEYSTDLFDADRIERLLDHVETLLRTAAADPGAPVSTLELLPAAERERVLTGFNDTAVAHDLGTPVHELFTARALATPGRVATLDETCTLTFAELDGRANALAWTLRSDHGVRPGDMVALFMRRGVHTTAAVLGVLKAGGAYVPIDLATPAARIATILDDSGCRVVLTDDPAAAAAVAGGRAVHDVTGPGSRATAPPGGAGPGDPAYCIYTSGSTGQPNGVVVEHRSLLNRLRWTTADLQLDDRDVFLQKTPSVFDVSVWELLLPGMLGARQVMLADGGQNDPARIREAVERHGVTVVHFVPSMLERYLAATTGGFRPVRHCVCSGEPLDDALAARFLDAVAVDPAPAALHNYYGPTEAAIDVSALRVRPQRPVTIGRPVANTHLYVLDPGGRPSPIGVTGELCISGVQVARGYRNRPGLTADRFVEDPFRPGNRMYRTGDLARWRPDGEIRLLGRSDHQITLRGLRIEPGEVEQALLDVPGVERAVVLLRTDGGTDGGTDGHLCAYLTGPAVPGPQRLRNALLDRLPAHTVPSHYVTLDALPVTVNGKVDRAALLADGTARHAGDEEPVAAQTGTEARLLDLWREILPAGDYGTADDFFVVGGTSLGALRLASRITGAFGVPVRLPDLLARRTVTDQAGLLTGPATRDAARGLRLRGRGPGDRHPLSFAQERLWFLRMLDPDSSGYHIRLRLRIDGPLDRAALRRAAQDLVDRHEMLRTTFTDDGGELRQQVRTDLPLPFTVRDLTAEPVEAARATARREAGDAVHRPFAPATESPLRLVLWRITPREHHLLVVLHHLAGDGWSMRLITTELSGSYARYRSGSGTPPPGPPALQYADYAESVRDPANLLAVEDDLHYWLRRLDGFPTLTLATDTGPDDTGPGGALSATVPAPVADRLHALAASSRSTLFEVTMATLTLLLSRLADQQDVVVGFPVANRQDTRLEPVVGLFLNTLALRTDLSGEPTFAELLGRVRTGVAEAYRHQEAPFELIVERLNPVRSLDRTPVFDVLLNYQDEPDDTLTLDGATVGADDDGAALEAKFALTFYVFVEGSTMRVDLAHRADLFGSARARTILGQLVTLLGQVGAAPHLPVAAHPLGGPGDGGLGTPLDRPEQVPVTELVARHARARPDAVAVEQGTAAIGYRDLVTRAAALAGHLVATGTRAGDVVAVTGARGIGFVVALLGVIGSGAVVFPLDPALPAGRRRHLLEIGRPARAVAVGDGPVDDGLRTVHLEHRTGQLAGTPAPAAAPPGPPAPGADAPAYLFFTSGTTGTPRGVLGRHAALSHFLCWQRDTFAIGPDDRCAQTTSASFDVMLRDTLVALVSGGTTVVPEPADETGGRALLNWLEHRRVTVLHAVPTVFGTWLLDAEPGLRLTGLRLLFLAGEPLTSALVETFRAAYPDSAEIVNLYGPTETTLARFAHPVPHGPLPRVLPVGRPLPQTAGPVMRGDVVCGVGEPGEIVIRTPFRSLGYLRDAAATRAVFVPNPYRDDPGDLLYRTGDLGRLRPDGVLEILGRADHQIKINGVRIQPSEVATVLAGHPGIATCLVDGVADAHAGIHLVAYVVFTAGGAPPARELRAYLAERLPAAMIPGQYIPLDRIPTTANGKPDRAALPAPRVTRDDTPAPEQAPATATERAVAAAWSQVLRRDTPGVHDDFFELGGTSLSLLRLYQRLDADHPGAVRVAQLFAHPTVAGQAALISPHDVRRPAEETEVEF